MENIRTLLEIAGYGILTMVGITAIKLHFQIKKMNRK
jgi:hypothetical protein